MYPVLLPSANEPNYAKDPLSRTPLSTICPVNQAAIHLCALIHGSDIVQTKAFAYAQAITGPKLASPRHITTIIHQLFVSWEKTYSKYIHAPPSCPKKTLCRFSAYSPPPIIPSVLTPPGPVWASAPRRCWCSSSLPSARSWAPAARLAPRGTDASAPAPPAVRSASRPALRWKAICPWKARHWERRHLGVSNFLENSINFWQLFRILRGKFARLSGVQVGGSCLCVHGWPLGVGKAPSLQKCLVGLVGSLENHDSSFRS